MNDIAFQITFALTLAVIACVSGTYHSSHPNGNSNVNPNPTHSGSGSPQPSQNSNGYGQNVNPSTGDSRNQQPDTSGQTLPDILFVVPVEENPGGKVEVEGFASGYSQTLANGLLQGIQASPNQPNQQSTHDGYRQQQTGNQHSGYNSSPPQTPQGYGTPAVPQTNVQVQPQTHPRPQSGYVYQTQAQAPPVVQQQAYGPPPPQQQQAGHRYQPPSSGSYRPESSQPASGHQNQGGVYQGQIVVQPQPDSRPPQIQYQIEQPVPSQNGHRPQPPMLSQNPPTGYSNNPPAPPPPPPNGYQVEPPPPPPNGYRVQPPPRAEPPPPPPAGYERPPPPVTYIVEPPQITYRVETPSPPQQSSDHYGVEQPAPASAGYRFDAQPVTGPASQLQRPPISYQPSPQDTQVIPRPQVLPARYPQHPSHPQEQQTGYASQPSQPSMFPGPSGPQNGYNGNNFVPPPQDASGSQARYPPLAMMMGGYAEGRNGRNAMNPHMSSGSRNPNTQNPNPVSQYPLTMIKAQMQNSNRYSTDQHQQRMVNEGMAPISRYGMIRDDSPQGSPRRPRTVIKVALKPTLSGGNSNQYPSVSYTILKAQPRLTSNREGGPSSADFHQRQEKPTSSNQARDSQMGSYRPRGPTSGYSGRSSHDGVSGMDVQPEKFDGYGDSDMTGYVSEFDMCEAGHDFEDFCHGKEPGLYSHPNPQCFLQCDQFGGYTSSMCAPGTVWNRDAYEPSDVNRCVHRSRAGIH